MQLNALNSRCLCRCKIKGVIHFNFHFLLTAEEIEGQHMPHPFHFSAELPVESVCWLEHSLDFYMNYELEQSYIRKQEGR